MNRLSCDSVGSLDQDVTAKQLQWKGAIPFLTIHLMCLWVIQTGVSVEWVALALGSYYLRMVVSPLFLAPFIQDQPGLPVSPGIFGHDLCTERCALVGLTPSAPP